MSKKRNTGKNHMGRPVPGLKTPGVIERVLSEVYLG